MKRIIYMDKRYEVVNKVMEYGIYAYILLMFLSKGEGIRNIIIFGNFVLWLFTIKRRDNLFLLKNSISILCFVLFGVTVLSVIFSTNPLYSFLEYKSEPLKFIMLFPVIATVMSNQTRLKNTIYVGFFTALLLTGLGYYSYIYFGNVVLLKPTLPLMHTLHNPFAKYLNTLIPFAGCLFFIWKRPALKSLLTISMILFAFALILNTSRSGLLAFLTIMIVWSLYIARQRKPGFKKMMSVIIISLIIVTSISLTLFPSARQRMLNINEDIQDMNGRIVAWEASLYGFKQKPIFGWGYGKAIFQTDEPFINTPFKKRPLYRDTGQVFDDPHNTFLMVLFHQGLVGLLPYTLLILLAIKNFWKEASRATGIKSTLLVACVAVLCGNYIVHSMFSILSLQDLAVILGLGVAATGTDEHSDH